MNSGPTTPGAGYGLRACRCILYLAVFFWLPAMACGQAFAAESGATISWSDYEPGMAKAKKECRFVLLDFYTSWCRDCKKMDNTTFREPEVARKLSAGFVAIKVDCDSRKDICSKYGVFAYPTYQLMSPEGEMIVQRVGYASRDELMMILDYADSGAYKEKSFNEFAKQAK